MPGLRTPITTKQDWKDFYATADKALALKPDDVDVLATVGWVIPHFYDPHDGRCGQAVGQGRDLEKTPFSLNTLNKARKPDGSPIRCCESSKASEAHSALGLVYFRREEYANSMAELQQATQNNPNPDPTDLFVLGMDHAKSE